MMDGYIRVRRGLMRELDDGCPWSPNAAVIWMAEHATFGEERDFRFQGRDYHLRRGELVSSHGEMAGAWHWSRGQVRAFLKRLVDGEWIGVRQEGNATIISLNRDRFACGRDNAQQSTQLTTQPRAQLRPGRTRKNLLYAHSDTRSPARSGTRTNLRKVVTKKDSPPAPSGAVPPEGGRRTRRERRKPCVALPPDFGMTSQRAAYLAEQCAKLNVPCPEPEAEMEDFRDHHAAKGSTFADWDAVWRRWARNAAKFRAERAKLTVIPGGKPRAADSPRSDRSDVPLAGSREDWAFDHEILRRPLPPGLTLDDIPTTAEIRAGRARPVYRSAAEG